MSRHLKREGWGRAAATTMAGGTPLMRCSMGREFRSSCLRSHVYCVMPPPCHASGQSLQSGRPPDKEAVAHRGGNQRVAIDSVEAAAAAEP